MQRKQRKDYKTCKLVGNKYMYYDVVSCAGSGCTRSHGHKIQTHWNFYEERKVLQTSSIHLKQMRFGANMGNGKSFMCSRMVQLLHIPLLRIARYENSLCFYCKSEMLCKKFHKLALKQ